jgi:SWI/SNF-related matrix-associated actin-dependent regulator of chromatin subfamily A member 5
VESYSKVFWERYTEINDYEKIITTIEKGEGKIKRVSVVQDLLAQKVTKYKNPMKDMKFVYGQSKGKHYTEEEDRFLVIKMHELGYTREDLYEFLRYEIRQSRFFAFDWFFKSRTASDLMRRCNTLVTILQREAAAELDPESKKKRKAPSSSLTEAKKLKDDEDEIIDLGDIDE